jgi:hypothetical protein
MEALRNMYKSMAQTKKMEDIENVADPKIMEDDEILAAGEKQADGKILADFSLIPLMSMFSSSLM